MEGYFKTNLALLKSRHAFTTPLPPELVQIPLEWQRRAEQLALGSDYQENGILYHSRRDPYREAHRQWEALANQQTHFLICLGVGLGYLLAPALASGVRDILLLEPRVETLFYLLNQLPPHLLQSLNLTIHCRAVANDTLEDILPWLQGKNIAQICLYQHRAAFQAFPQIYLPLAERLKNLLEKRSINQATLVKFQELWNRNILLNSKALLHAIPYARLLQEVRCDNVVVAGAGPSLTQSIPQLLKHRDKFLLFAADTAFIPLARSGVIPDLVFSADPQFLNWYFATHRLVAQTLWVIDPVVIYHIPHFLYYHKAPLMAWNNVFQADALLRQVTQDRGDIAHGGSVSTNAFDTARKIAQQKVILIGQDLSFSGKVAHAKGAALENLVFLNTNRFYRMEAHNLKQMNALPKLPVETISGETGFTNAKLKVFIDWFEQQAASHRQPPLFCNATAQGVKLRGFVHASLDDLLTTAQPVAPLSNFIGNNVSKKKEQLIILWQDLKKDIQKLRKIYQENLLLHQQLQCQPQNRNLLDRLSQNDEIIKNTKPANDLLALNAQKVILRITEGGDTSRPEELYQVMARSAKELELLLTKVIHSLEYDAKKI